VLDAPRLQLAVQRHATMMFDKFKLSGSPGLHRRVAAVRLQLRTA
jgi:hypothetical protein